LSFVTIYQSAKITDTDAKLKHFSTNGFFTALSLWLKISLSRIYTTKLLPSIFWIISERVLNVNNIYQFNQV
jgi:hypothetical protein